MPPDAPFGESVIKALEKIGFAVELIAGSHHILKHPDGRFLTVPVHRNQDLQRGIYRKILKDAEMSDEELKKLL
jgi:predicted RNA binding protein YcfA (HicA-like mRNA interferase family)